MNLNDIKLIAIDLDGTLLNSKSNISNRNKKILHKLIEKDYQIVIATGRNYYEAKRFTKEFSQLNYLINNGCSLF